ncbi:hypothetical protein [Amycolatopsis sp. SID8362]|uniref:hypothetical protein n=1 Tax=Amycolatopsis sp. SID8362 TaxID=2690346 RepID=UPI00136DB6A6|nr:hypothetical protein [Amycolatopsis sp. SID8362]NBH11870.1 hypothetical protein [Amycolatopsis sp. SID8362]NED48561.1 hypothetical protein [Amycolatopsis sp. SID8362]
MIARRPTFDGDVLTASVYILDLPDPHSGPSVRRARYQVGAYRDVLLRQRRNALGRTMWQFPGGRLGAGEPAPAERDDLIAFGPLLSDDGGTGLGTAALVRAPDPAAARAVLTGEEYATVEVRAWRPGGRPG